MKNYFAVSTNTYHGFSLDEALNGISKAGFKYVELAAVKGYTEHVGWEMTDDELQKVKDKLDDYGLMAIAVSGHSSLLEEDGIELFIKNIELAGRLGCKYIVTSTGEAHGDESVVEDDSALVNTLKDLAEKCKENGVKLVIETHGNNYGNGEVLYNLLSKVDSEYVGINYDTANAIFYGNVEPEEDILKCKEKLYYIHLKDKLGERQEWNFPAVGKGYIDFKKIFKNIEQTGYQGPLSVEVEFTSEGPGSLENVDQAVKDSYEYIQTLL
ncbi:MAG: sugar phosphate isomerase/epimerase [Clostridia bacterium]|nr:sugar phosphate isomerase/epimerase [Clostridia bacterium]